MSCFYWLFCLLLCCLLAYQSFSFKSFLSLNRVQFARVLIRQDGFKLYRQKHVRNEKQGKKKTVRVTFKADVEGIGRKGEIKKISASYFMNVLHPRNLARQIFGEELKRILEAEEARQEEDRQLSLKLSDNTNPILLFRAITANETLIAPISLSEAEQFVRERIASVAPNYYLPVSSINVTEIYPYDNATTIRGDEVPLIEKEGLYQLMTRVHPKSSSVEEFFCDSYLNVSRPIV
jgi:hypothetical protein